MFAWWRRRQREKILQSPFPDSWRQIIGKNVGYASQLDDEERIALEELVQVFIAEKEFLGCGGLEIDDEVRVTIAANACILLLGLAHDLYGDVQSILVYPSTVRPPERAQNLGGSAVAIVAPSAPILGQAELHGPVVLVWDAVAHGSRYAANGYNVVFHEFAHKMDMLDNEIDGTPPLRTTEQYRRWSKVCGDVYFEMKKRAARGQPTFLDQYGATSEAEFFAVATEFFFEKAKRMKSTHPELYDVLREFYRQDPAARVRSG
jgi:MtfA peptidase